MWKDKIIPAIIGASIPLVIAAVGLFIGIGRFIERFEQIEMTLTERFEQIEERLEEDDDETNARRNRFFSIYREPGKPIDFSNSGTAGLWSDPIECPPAHYVCRLRQRVSNPGGYESRVTAIGFSCCSLAAPAEE